MLFCRRFIRNDQQVTRVVLNRYNTIFAVWVRQTHPRDVTGVDKISNVVEFLNTGFVVLTCLMSRYLISRYLMSRCVAL